MFFIVPLLLLALALKVVHLVYKFYMRPPANLKKFGEWCVVTGATDGIGLAYATALAKKGINVVLVSRTQSKLDACKKELEDKFKVQVKTVAIDYMIFSKDQIIDALDEVKSLDIGILVNNVGQSYDYPEYVLDLPQDKVDNMVKMNVSSVTDTTSVFLPGMAERKRGVRILVRVIVCLLFVSDTSVFFWFMIFPSL